MLQNSGATLPCPQTDGNVSWTRYRDGTKTTLAIIEKGEDKIYDKRFGVLADNSLVIMKVLLSDSGMYMCNFRQIYLNVTTDPKSVGSTFGLNGKNGDEEPADQTSSDIWKTAAPGAAAAVLALLSVVTLILYLKRRRQKNQNQTVTEVIYEEVKDVVEEPWLENPYVYISETAAVSNLYSKVDKQRRSGGEECVYSLAQTSPQTGSLGPASHYHAVA